MANSRSAIKRIRVAERNRQRNKAYKSAVKTLIKGYLAAVDEYEANPSQETEEKVAQSMAKAYSKIDKAVKRGVLHANNGARKKSRLARLLAKKKAGKTNTPELQKSENAETSAS